MSFQQIIDTITPEIYANLRRAIEIGKWPDGRALTSEQRELSLQAIIAYEARNLSEVERTGFIDRGSKAEGQNCGDENRDDVAANPLKWT